MTFTEKLALSQKSSGTRLCVGLDPVPERLPTHLQRLPVADAVVTFCQAIVEATSPVACAFKPNLAFFEALGRDGHGVLEHVLQSIPTDRLVVLDGKRSDIAHSAAMYAESLFGTFHADACTVAPYMGRDAIIPFLAVPGRCAFVLVRTSNASAGAVQNLVVDGVPLYRWVASSAVEWGSEQPAQIGFVVGASDIDALRALRAAHPEVPFLIPGVGAQGGSAADCIAAAGSGPMLVNSSRQILYASNGEDFPEAAFQTAGALARQLPASV
jgi:orotidine-5'-phosphate decarboxylase